ncbi:hypothetical protein ACJX0J_024855, partial [Zea mays]
STFRLSEQDCDIIIQVFFKITTQFISCATKQARKTGTTLFRANSQQQDFYVSLLNSKKTWLLKKLVNLLGTFYAPNQIHYNHLLICSMFQMSPFHYLIIYIDIELMQIILISIIPS